MDVDTEITPTVVNSHPKSKTKKLLDLSVFEALLRNNIDKDICEFTECMLNYLSHSTASLRSALYIFNNFEKVLELKSTYGIDDRDIRLKKIGLKEGIIGQSIQDKKCTILEPNPPIKIQCSSGGIAIENILIVPLLINGIEPLGAIEFYYRTAIDTSTIKNLESAANSLSAVLNSLISRIQTENLLEASQIREQKLIKMEADLKKSVQKLESSNKEIRKKQQEVVKTNIQLKENKLELHNAINALEGQKSEIEQKNSQITASINCALDIQSRIIPSIEEIQSKFQDAFIYYLPKDIVSGDFFFQHITKQKTTLAVIDCEGHGVPGAFMSLIGHSLLKNIVIEDPHISPGKILAKLHLRVLNYFNAEKHGNISGMDISICSFENAASNQKEVVFAGANRPLFYTKKDEIFRVSGVKKSIGKSKIEDIDAAFEEHTIQLEKDDCVYITTDGITDAPNPKRKRFGSNGLLTFISSNHSLPMNEQKINLETELNQFLDGQLQRDDITLLGIKL